MRVKVKERKCLVSVVLGFYSVNSLVSVVTLLAQYEAICPSSWLVKLVFLVKFAIYFDFLGIHDKTARNKFHDQGYPDI